MVSSLSQTCGEWYWWYVKTFAVYFPRHFSALALFDHICREYSRRLFPLWPYLTTFAVYFPGICFHSGGMWKHLPYIFPAFVAVLASVDHICRVISPAFVSTLAVCGNICRIIQGRAVQFAPAPDDSNAYYLVEEPFDWSSIPSESL
ncbi:hypothetical protein ACLD5M_01580 [Gardnerella sp. Marseille-Q9185]|uniref:hypothetical protein n=1 Tax=Gardnerella sp. Marseille-Q9185 TaxID=3390094 RepID=UPI003970B933